MTDAAGVSKQVYDEIVYTPAGSELAIYFYSYPLSDDTFLLYGVDTQTLDAQVAAIRELGPILSSVAVGKEGFVFAVDKQTGRFMYYNDGIHDFTGSDIH